MVVERTHCYAWEPKAVSWLRIARASKVRSAVWSVAPTAPAPSRPRCHGCSFPLRHLRSPLPGSRVGTAAHSLTVGRAQTLRSMLLRAMPPSGAPLWYVFAPLRREKSNNKEKMLSGGKGRGRLWRSGLAGRSALRWRAAACGAPDGGGGAERERERERRDGSVERGRVAAAKTGTERVQTRPASPPLSGCRVRGGQAAWENQRPAGRREVDGRTVLAG